MKMIDGCTPLITSYAIFIMYWYIRTGKNFSLPMKLATDGIRYSKVFVLF